MNQEQDQELVKNFPNLYKDRYGDMKNTCLCWGFECGSGWYNLIYELSEKLEEKILEIKKQNPPVRFYKIKKKFDNILMRANYKILNFFGWRHPIGSKITRALSLLRPKLGVEYFPCASQVKEKYGTLRFYMTCETDEMSKIIRTAEKKSAITCEGCGLPGKRNTLGWISTLCNQCRGSDPDITENEE